MKPTLSFIVAAYNAANFLPAALDSALSQQLDVPFEVVVINDASTDATSEVIARYCDRFPQLMRSWTNEKNLGGGATRNRAIHEACGELLFMLDSDNVLPTGLAQKVLERHREAGLEAASVERLRFFRNDIAHFEYAWLAAHDGGKSSLRHLFKSTSVPASHGNYLFTRRLFESAGRYEEDRGAMDTWTFGLKHLLRGLEVAIAPGTFYFHRIGRTDSFWTLDEKRGVNDSNAIAVLRRHLKELPPDLQEKVASLEPSDKLFTYIDAGLFEPEISREEFWTERHLLRSPKPATTGRFRRVLGRHRRRSLR